VAFSEITQELGRLVDESKKPNLSREQKDDLAAQHHDIAGRMARLYEFESAFRIVILVAVALLISGIVQEMLGLHW
jgi:hypothetical protein